MLGQAVVLYLEVEAMNHKQPRYYNEFRCVGGTCPISCCCGWSIFWTRDEIDKVKKSPKCSKELRALMESKFHPSPDGVANRFTVSLGKDGDCPFLTEDKFCRIQRELGAKYLSIVCSRYPRQCIATLNINYRFCDMACPSVVSFLLNDEKSTELIIELPKQSNSTSQGGAIEIDPAKYPEHKYYGKLFEMFYGIISDKKNSLETNIVLGALAAKALSKIVESGEYGDIPEAIDRIKLQLNDDAQIRAIDNIKPNYYVKLGIAGGILPALSNDTDIMSSLTDKTGTLNIDLYNQGELRLAEAYKDRPWYMRNIALNFLLAHGVPFKQPEKSIYDNYVVFVVAIAMIKLGAIAVAERNVRAEAADTDNSGIDDGLIKVVSDVSRSLSNNIGRATAMLEGIQELNISSPAFLALFIK